MTGDAVDGRSAGMDTPIAVTGLGCRFPGGADSPAQFWQVLVEGRDAIREGPHGRWDVEAFYDPNLRAVGRITTRHAGYLDDIEGFDAAFFGVSAREAAAMDPQHRLLLEVAWEALEHAGVPPRSLSGTRTGVFAGLTYVDYLQRLNGRYDRMDAYVGTGSAHSTAVGRIAYLLGLTGPAIAVDTACSSSLVAIHLAAQSLRLGECDLALAGGAGLLIRPEGMIIASRWGMLSPTGRCRSFDAGADGFVRSEGAGVVTLKRLSDATRDGDRVLAVLRGSAVNQDGRSQGMTAPSASAQRAVLAEAVRRAGVEPARVGLVETHGTGTALGDPIEFTALAGVYGDAPDRCALGAVKSTIGHTEAAAGVAGFIKAVLSLRQGVVPPNLHFTGWNPGIPGAGSRFFVPTEATAWPVSDGQRLAAVSSFGMSGTNAHAVLEQAPATQPAAPTAAQPATPTADRNRIFLLSAGAPDALVVAARRLADALSAQDAPPLDDVAHTLAVRRSHHPVRLAVVAADRAQLLARLTAFADAPDAVADGWAHGTAWHGTAPVWVFSGQGSQWPGMGRRLLDEDPAFAATVAELEPLIHAEAGFRLSAVLRSGAPLGGIGSVQPVLFAVQVALAAAWRARGVTPAAVIGHSMGEIAAAVVSGALSPLDGVRVVCRRSRLLTRLSGAGAMAFVDLPADEVSRDLVDGVTVAVLASPRGTVVAGAADGVHALVARWQADGLLARPVAVDVASHSPQVDPVLDELLDDLAGLTPRPPAVPFYSTVDPDPRAPRPVDGLYWRDNLRRPVRFTDAVAAAVDDGLTTFVEMSPHPVLSHAIAETVAARGHTAAVVATLTRDRDGADAVDAGVALLHCLGAPVQWGRHHGAGHLADLPTTSWHRRRHWIDLDLPHPADGLPTTSGHPLLGTAVIEPGEPGRYLWQHDIGTDPLPWLADHRIHGIAVLPGAAFGELALAAAVQCFDAPAWEVTVARLHLERPLPVGPSTVITARAAKESPTSARWEIGSGSGAAWIRHATAELRHEPRTDPPAAPVEPAAGAHGQPTELPVAALYAALRAAGFEHGPAFAGLIAVHTTDDSALAEVRLPVPARSHDRGYHLHPCLLDSCLQALAAVHLAGGGRTALLPAAIGALRVHGDPARTVRCVARLDAADDGTLFGRVWLLAENGNVLATVDELRLVSVERDLGSTRVGAMFHDIRWQPGGLDPAPRRAEGRWLFLGTDGPLLRRLPGAVAAAGGDAIAVPLTAMVTPWPADASPYRNVVLLATGGPAEPAPATGQHHVARILDLVRRLSRADGDPPRLWLVTRGGQPVRPTDAVSPDQAAVRGIGRVATFEHAELRPTLVDLDPDLDDVDATATQLVTELCGDNGDDETAWRDGSRFVARLVAAPFPTGRWDRRPRRRARHATDGIGLDLATPGDLDTLEPVLRPRRAPGPGEVEIRVRAAALNFRDVFVAMGLHPPVDGRTPLLGSDVAGVVTAVGDGVTTTGVGEEVFGLAEGGLGSFVVTPAVLVAPLPAGLSAPAAAALPVAALTAWYALHHVARVAAGERVLVHAGTGGVGLAAIAVARAAGAEVFATAGSETKRRYLRDLGVVQVMDSRSLDFRDEVLDQTCGRGVDVVLNSLSGPALRAGLETLAVGGRFVEIGKRDIYADRTIGLLPFRRNISLSSVDLDLLFRHRPQLAATLLDEVTGALDAGRLAPLPYRAMPFDEAAEAFGTLAAATHIGKLVLTMADDGHTDAVVPPGQVPVVRAGGGYVVTGGLGGLGLEVAEWLAAHGAGRIVLGGRRPPSPEATERLVRLRAAGTAVEVLLGDIAEPGVAERLVAAATAGGLTLAGVAHAAGVLADALMSTMDDAGLDRVWRPKVTGARRLHEATVGHRPGWFLLFSSAAAMFGNPGQASYAAANAWLDGFAFWRRQQGLPATSVNWGPWSGLGMAAGIGHRGHAMIDPADGIAALETILDHDCTRVGVFPLDPRELLRVLPTAAGSPFFAAVPMPETGTGRTGGAPTAAALAALPPERRGPALVAQLGTHIDAILGAGTAGDDPNAPMVHAGLDSLTALQLRSRLETDLGLAIPTAAVWTYPSVAALARYLLGRLRLADGSVHGSDGRTAGWFVRLAARPAAAVRLVAFPYLGGGASAYRAWADALPGGVELCAVQLPGREHRADEPFATDLHALAAEVAGALAADADPRPYALFGHSGGALLAYETARALRRLGAPAPVLLAVSAMLPPHHPRWDTQIRAALLERPAEEIAALAADRPGPLDDPAVAAALLPAVRADAAMYAGYAYESEAPLDCPVVAYTGTEDHLYRPAEVAGWRSVTSGRTSTRSYPGGHFYFRHQTAEVTADLGADLSAAGDAG